MIVEQKESPISNDEVMATVFKRIKARENRDIQQALNDEKALKAIYKEKSSGDYTGKGRAKWRRMARIPAVLYNAAIRMYGPEVFKDKSSFKELMKRPEMEPFLTVPIKEL